MSDNQFFGCMVIGMIAVVVGAIAWGVIEGVSAVPISGVVTQKIEASNGYGDVVHVMQIEVRPEKYTWITTSARVYLSVVEGARYEFNGPKDGRSYDSMEAVGE